MRNKFINIEYNEGEGQESYKAIELTERDDSVLRFDTGDFQADWNDMVDYIRVNSREDEIILKSSSVDDFFTEEPCQYECAL